MKKWIVIAAIVIGVLAFAAVIWFVGPLIGWADVYPLEAEWIRILIILVVCGGIGLFYLVRFLMRRSAAKRLEEGLVNSGDSGSDAKVLSDRMAEALATLKGSTGKSNYLYSMPWYVIIGPPGAGKTTALLKSGLKFPLAGADGGASIAGAGGTRYCDWWFTDEAVLIDTAGRYTTQDSDADADKKSWLSFLQLLKRNRPKQPINGVIVAISLSDVMTLTKSELSAHAAAIRKRLIEVHQELKIDFPVYALFTKADLVAGFNEYFGNFTEARRRKVWGATFQTEDRRKNMVGAVPAEFDALVKRLTEELPDRLQEEPDATTRIAIFDFPAQFGLLKENVNEFLQQIFEPNRYQVNANLRGFYFSSGTQEGTPIDQVLGVMDRSFGASENFRQMSGLGKSYFLHDLITRVIFSETGWVSLDKGAVRRSQVVRYGIMGAVALATVVLLGAWAWSYFNNDSLIKNTDQFVANYRVNTDALLQQVTVSGADTDIMTALPALDMLRSMPVGFASKGQAVPVEETFGLSQRERLAASGEEAYRQGLERFMRSRMILRLERQLQDSINDPLVTYETLKVYMMLGGMAPDVDQEMIVAWMAEDWNNLYPGPSDAPARASLENHLRAMLQLEKGRRPSFDLNGLLIEQAQRTLTRLSVADQAYAYLKSLEPATPIEDFFVASHSGPEGALVFETVDGSDFTELKVPFLFTYRGFHEHFLGELASIAEQLSEELWVRGEIGKAIITEDQFADLGPQLIDLYSVDFVTSWNATLDNLKFKTLPGTKPDYTVLSVLSNPVTSPLKALVQGIAAETQLTKEVAPAGVEAQVDAAADAAEKALAAATQQQLQSRTAGLQRIGINFGLGKADGRPGETAQGSQIPGAAIEDQFKDYAILAEGAPAPIDTLVTTFGEVFQSLFVAATNPSQAQQANANLQLQVANLGVNASRLPPPLRRMVAAAAGDLENDAAGSSLAQLNQQLQSQITRFCDETISNRFPFAEGGSREVQMADFSRLFAPNGLMDQFFAQNLSPLADLSGEEWTWKPDTALGRELSNTTLREFQRAAEIRDAFFPPGSPNPNVTVTFSQAQLSPGAQGAILDVNGQVIQTQQVGNTPKTIQWPGAGGGAVTITILPEMVGRQSTETVQGPWALMRLLQHNNLGRQGDTISVQITVGGRGVIYNIQVGTALNPFFLDALSEFSCPTGL
jgi:type VI secretion system protein ImpL